MISIARARFCDVKGGSRRRRQILRARMELDPRTPQLAFFLASVYAAMRAYPDAVRYLDRTIALNPRWAGIYADRAIDHARQEWRR